MPNNVIVLSERAWRTRFGADANLVGRTLQLDGQRVEVIGVMPADVRASAALGHRSTCGGRSRSHPNSARTAATTTCGRLRV